MLDRQEKVGFWDRRRNRKMEERIRLVGGRRVRRWVSSIAAPSSLWLKDFVICLDVWIKRMFVEVWNFYQAQTITNVIRVKPSVVARWLKRFAKLPPITSYGCDSPCTSRKKTATELNLVQPEFLFVFS